ncbi:RNA polymerase sigma factor [Clostridium sp. UBA6640]|uniref:RNA polymerase sigma factor n=1 Tax=Clostridium sp. UBA6640 TaxID=1946370 RepID=UPI0025C67905|nr:sigma-70 family RNA polymerase sigma factor [Clostridium sp. UBA6640]
MNESLFQLIENSQKGDKISLLLIIEKFSPSIKKFSRKLGYDGADTDLIISFIKTIKELKLTDINLENEGTLVNYLYNSIKFKYIDLMRKYLRMFKRETELNLEIIESKYTYEIEDNIYVEDLLRTLSRMQRIILEERYIKNYSDIEIANKLNISRQAVNKTKNKALENLRTYMNTISI